jgi:UDP-glucose 4-epimerase
MASGKEVQSNLITGGAGFIGSHLAEYLLEQGERVVIVDDLSTGSLDNIKHLRSQRGLEFVHDTVLNRTLLDSLTANSDRVFHLAAAVGVELIVKHPARVIETNILGTETILAVCVEYKVPVFIASTSEVYGKSEKMPFREDDDIVLGPTSKSRWSYACSKAVDEFLALAYHQSRGLPAVVGRFFNTAGPRQTGQYGMVIPRFVGQALAGDPMTVYGSGEQTRCFCHVRDVVAAVARLIEAPEAYGQVFNLGSRELVSMNELAARVKDRTGSSSEITHVPFEEAYVSGFEDIAAREPDISKARAVVGFEPQQTLDEILADVIASMQNRPAQTDRAAR